MIIGSSLKITVMTLSTLISEFVFILITTLKHTILKSIDVEVKKEKG